MKSRKNETGFAFERKVRVTILQWFAGHRRNFLWREQHAEASLPPDPYIVLVSEIMLQQTQTARVQEKLPLFLHEFPTLQALAKADSATVIRAWAGMGYNSRALRLRDCAKVIVERHHGQIPASVPELLALPGIGPYTASAVVAFAYHGDIAVVDVNIRRVYSRLLAAMPSTSDVADERTVSAFAERIYPRGESSQWHQAVMDIGALFCTARAPKCGTCPIETLCASAHRMQEIRKEKRPEPSWKGTPNRIWRGRVVQMLRELEGNTTLSFGEVEQRLFAELHQSESLFEMNDEARHTRAEWLVALLTGLERDGILEIQRQRKDKRGGNDTDDFSQFFLRLSKG